MIRAGLHCSVDERVGVGFPACCTICPRFLNMLGHDIECRNCGLSLAPSFSLLDFLFYYFMCTLSIDLFYHLFFLPQDSMRSAYTHQHLLLPGSMAIMIIAREGSRERSSESLQEINFER